MPTPPSPITRRRAAVVLAAALATGATASANAIFSLAPNPDLAVHAGISTPGLHYRYGSPVELGNGRARTYVIVHGMTGHPVEVGVALSEQALEGLPEQSPDHGPGTHGPYSEYLLELPGNNPTPYKFVEVDWNPQGHGGRHTAPHFDFHFYRVPLATRNGIDLAAPDFAERAARLPSVGTWDGQVIFDEPMVTRDFILAQRTNPTAESIAVPATRRYAQPGLYPASYGITWDERRREYRIALTGLTRKG